MRYDNQMVEQARNTDMLTFLSQYRGFSFRAKGGEYRCKEHPSLSVKADRLTWYWHSRSIGGRGALDFLMRLDGMTFHDAMAALTGAEPSAPIPCPPLSAERTQLILPEKAGFLYKRLYAYLNRTRGIDSGIITALIHDKKIYEDKRGNIVFVGYDENSVPRFASLRGTYTDKTFRMDCAGSDKRYGFSMVKINTDRLYVFEAPIDCMSHATIEVLKTNISGAWRNQSRLSLGGTSGTALGKYLELHNNVRELTFCLDNDSAGHKAADNLAREYERKGYVTRIELPLNKDYNEDLLRLREEGLIIDERKKHLNRDCR